MDLFKLEGKLDAINRRLDNIEEQLSASRLPSYTGSREADHILEVAYTNNESIAEVAKRLRKRVKSKVGKDLDKLDDIVDRSSEVASARGESDFFNSLSEGRDTAGDGYNEWKLSKGECDRDGI